MADNVHRFTTNAKGATSDDSVTWGEDGWENEVDTVDGVDFENGSVRPRTNTTTLTWETGPDWDGARSRGRVVTRDVGVRSPDEIRLGYDPATLPFGGDIVAYWPFDESSGDTAADAVGSHAMSINGGTLGATGILGSNAIDNGGGSRNATVDYDAGFYQNDFSVAVWTNTFDLGTQSQCWVDTRTPDQWDDGWLIRQLDDNRPLRFNVLGSGTIELSDTLLEENAWNLMVCVHDYTNDVMKFHVNGQLRDTASGLSPVTDSGRFLRFFDRADVNGESLNGRACDVMYVGRALTDPEVDDLWQTVRDGHLTTGAKTT